MSVIKVLVIGLLLGLYPALTAAQGIDSSLLQSLQTDLLKPGDAVSIPFISYVDANDFHGENLRNLNTILAYLQQNIKITIQFANHTDCRGSEEYNLKFSQYQAKILAKWFVVKGVDQNRITHEGYGETKPVAPCNCNNCTEEEHFANRRLEVILLSLTP
jgi:hypothetical protein